MAEPHAIKLTRSQLRQLDEFLDQSLDEVIAEGVEGERLGPIPVLPCFIHCVPLLTESAT